MNQEKINKYFKKLGLNDKEIMDPINNKIKEQRQATSLSF
jgi:hypothetical protein